MRNKSSSPLLLLIVNVMLYLFVARVHAENIDPDNNDSQFAYAENTGWINLEPGGDGGPGVVVDDVSMSGYLWGENIGWINLNPQTRGVKNDGYGHFYGYAWGENTGWINFAPVGGGVSIDACGDFNGRAWGENIGWISFRSEGATSYRVTTSWVSPVDEVAPETSSIDPVPTWYTGDATITLTATDCGSGVRDLRYILDGNDEVITADNNVTLNVLSDGIHSLSFYATDNVNNIESSAYIITIQIDKTPPLITLNTPAENVTYNINQAVLADYAITDNLSGISLTIATQDNGHPIDTSTSGSKFFTVYAEDIASNTSTLTHNYTVVYPGNIDPDNDASHYAYAENLGWSNFKPSYGPGITVTGSSVTGFVWSENIGWVNLKPTHGGIVNDGNGNLSGYAWSENVGWINFAPTGGRVIIDTGGNFSGWAWGENIGWIHFQNISIPYKVKTAWMPQIVASDLNSDGCIDRVDLPIILTEIRRPTPHEPSYDLNGDGAVNIADARYLVTQFTHPRGVSCE
jgi:hypothetical protein